MGITYYLSRIKQLRIAYVGNTIRCATDRRPSDQHLWEMVARGYARVGKNRLFRLTRRGRVRLVFHNEYGMLEKARGGENIRFEIGHHWSLLRSYGLISVDGNGFIVLQPKGERMMREWTTRDH